MTDDCLRGTVLVSGLSQLVARDDDEVRSEIFYQAAKTAERMWREYKADKVLPPRKPGHFPAEWISGSRTE